MFLQQRCRNCTDGSILVSCLVVYSSLIVVMNLLVPCHVVAPAVLQSCTSVSPCGCCVVLTTSSLQYSKVFFLRSMPVMGSNR